MQQPIARGSFVAPAGPATGPGARLLKTLDLFLASCVHKSLSPLFGERQRGDFYLSYTYIFVYIYIYMCIYIYVYVYVYVILSRERKTAHRELKVGLRTRFIEYSPSRP